MDSVQDPNYCPPRKRAWRFFRRWWLIPVSLLVMLGYRSYNLHQGQHNATLSVAVDNGQLNADNPQVVEALQNTLPPFGDAFGKSVISLGIFMFGLGLVFAVMHTVVPAIVRYLLSDFKSDFLALDPKWKICISLGVWQSLLLYWDICWLAASLVK